MADVHSTIQWCLDRRVKTSITMLVSMTMLTVVVQCASLPIENPAPSRIWWPDGQTLSVHPKRSGDETDLSTEVPNDPRPKQGTGGPAHSLYAMQRGGILCEPRAPTCAKPTAQFLERATSRLFDTRDEQVVRCYHEQPIESNSDSSELKGCEFMCRPQCS